MRRLRRVIQDGAVSELGRVPAGGPTRGVEALRDIVRSAALPKEVCESVRAGARAARQAFRHGDAWDGLDHIQGLRGADIPASVAQAIQARIDAITECLSAANGEVAHASLRRPLYRWPF